MNRFELLHRKPLVLALALAGAVGVAGTAFAQQPYTSPTSPSSATSPSKSADTAAGMSSKAGMPSKTDTSDAAWQKLGSKGYVSKDDVKDLSGFSFESADANSDGRLSQDEFRKAWSTYSGASGSTSSSTMPSSSSSSSAPSDAAPK
jgi:hypothetical protein